MIGKGRTCSSKRCISIRCKTKKGRPKNPKKAVVEENISCQQSNKANANAVDHIKGNHQGTFRTVQLSHKSKIKT